MHPITTNPETRQTSRPGMSGVIGDRFRRWFKASALRWQRDRTTKALQNLDDRMLADIGLHRSDIPLVVERLIERELQTTPVSKGSDKPSVKPDEMRIAA